MPLRIWEGLLKACAADWGFRTHNRLKGAIHGRGDNEKTGSVGVTEIYSVCLLECLKVVYVTDLAIFYFKIPTYFLVKINKTLKIQMIKLFLAELCVCVCTHIPHMSSQINNNAKWSNFPQFSSNDYVLNTALNPGMKSVSISHPAELLHCGRGANLLLLGCTAEDCWLCSSTCVDRSLNGWLSCHHSLC